MPNYSREQLKTNLAKKVSGTIPDGDWNTIINDAVLEVVGDVDMRSMKRKSQLAPNMFDGIFDYTCPSTMKGNAIIDIRPQVQRGRFDDWRLTTEEEFDRLKEDNRLDQYGDPIRIGRSQWLGDSICAISDADFVRKLKISRPIDDDTVTIDPLDAVGTWVGFGDGENVSKDSDNYVKGSACLNWDIGSGGGTTAGIYNASVEEFDVTEYATNGSVFVWAYISSATDLTNFILRIGSGSTAYYSITITANNEGASFYAGWNLLRFDLANKVPTGTVDEDACDYVAIYMTKDAGKVSETDYRFDNILLKKGNVYDVIYYSKYGWQDDGGTWLENSTEDTDLLNVEADELKLIEYKAAELGERELRSHANGDRMMNLYENKRKEYQFRYPSEAMVLSTTSHFL